MPGLLLQESHHQGNTYWPQQQSHYKHVSSETLMVGQSSFAWFPCAYSTLGKQTQAIYHIKAPCSQHLHKGGKW